MGRGQKKVENPWSIVISIGDENTPAELSAVLSLPNAATGCDIIW